jgi:hypothetical protein
LGKEAPSGKVAGPSGKVVGPSGKVVGPSGRECPFHLIWRTCLAGCLAKAKDKAKDKDKGNDAGKRPQRSMKCQSVLWTFIMGRKYLLSSKGIGSVKGVRVMAQKDMIRAVNAVAVAPSRPL